MTKAFTEWDFSDQINQDRSWRLKEISDLKSSVLRADSALQKVLLRALVAICYAHFEGFVRFSAQKYMEYVAIRRLPYSELNRQFLRNYFLPRLASLSTTRASVKERCDVVDKILSSGEVRFSRYDPDTVSTRSNLNSDVLKDICMVCGVPYNWFSGKEAFIDVFLLKRRNSIAHGEETLIDIEDLEELTSETVSLMRAFGDELENIVHLKRYRAG